MRIVDSFTEIGTPGELTRRAVALIYDLRKARPTATRQEILEEVRQQRSQLSTEYLESWGMTADTSAQVRQLDRAIEILTNWDEFHKSWFRYYDHS